MVCLLPYHVLVDTLQFLILSNITCRHSDENVPLGGVGRRGNQIAVMKSRQSNCFSLMVILSASFIPCHLLSDYEFTTL